MITTVKLVKVLTPTEAIAADAAGVLKAGLKHRIPFTAEDGNDYSVDFYPSKLGKVPGAGKLNHHNGETYEVKFGLVVTGGIYPADTVEVYRCEDHRGNVFMVCENYIVNNLGYNPLWYFWWGDDKVSSNEIVDATVESSSGVAPDLFQANIVHNSSLYIVNTPWVAPDPVAGLLNVEIADCRITNVSSVDIGVSTFYGVSFNYMATLTSCAFEGATVSISTTDTNMIGVKMTQGCSYTNLNCEAVIANLELSDRAIFAIEGTGAASEITTIAGGMIRGGSVVAHPPVGGARTHTNLDIQGWTVTLSPDQDETNLKLSRTTDAGVLAYESNLAVFKDCTSLADLDADGYIVMTGTRDRYAGIIALGGLGNSSVGATVIEGVKRESNGLDNRKVRLAAVLNSSGGVPAYASVVVHPSATDVDDWEILGQTTEIKHLRANNPAENIILLLRTKTAPATASYCVMTQVTDFD